MYYQVTSLSGHCAPNFLVSVVAGGYKIVQNDAKLTLNWYNFDIKWTQMQVSEEGECNVYASSLFLSISPTVYFNV